MNFQRPLSFYTMMRGKIGEILEGSELSCRATEKAIAEVAGDLGLYREEGVDLFPTVCFCHSVTSLIGMIGGAEHIQVGEGPIAAPTARKALKSCAPIGAQGAIVYVERDQHLNKFRYGVISPPQAPFFGNSVFSLVVQKAENPVIALVRRVSRASVIVQNASNEAFPIYFSAEKDDVPLPQKALLDLVQSASSAVAAENCEITKAYLLGTLEPILTRCHGTLIGVLRANQADLPEGYQDAHVLKPFLDIGERVRSFDQSAASLDRLLMAQRMLEGMIQCDGAVLMRADATIVSFRTFFTLKKATAGSTSGGARSRAFEAMKAMVGTDLIGAYMRSQDGTSFFHGA